MKMNVDKVELKSKTNKVQIFLLYFGLQMRSFGVNVVRGLQSNVNSFMVLHFWPKTGQNPSKFVLPVGEKQVKTTSFSANC